MSWPGPFQELDGDVERAAWKMGDGTVDFTFVEPREPAHTLKLEVLSMEEALARVKGLYDRSTAAQLPESEPPKKVKELRIVIPTIPLDKPRTVFKEKMVGLVGGTGRMRRRGNGWTATDPAWRAVVGSGRTKWGAEHSLRVQIAAVAWRRIGGRIGCGPGSPLPCVLTKEGAVWAASSWREGLPAEFGVGRTVEEALSSLVHVRGGAPELRHPAVEWKDEPSFRVFDKQESGWYGADPV